MGQDTKISLLPLFTNPGQGFPDDPNVRIPVADNGSNHSISLQMLYSWIGTLIDAKVAAAIASYDSQNPGGGGSGSGQTTDLTALTNRISAAEDNIQSLMSPSNWPKNKIILDRGTNMNPIPYTLPTGYGESGTTVTIHDSQAALPNFYVVTSIGTWTTPNDELTFRVDIQVRNYMDTLQLSGGTIGAIKLLGTYTTSNGVYELSEVTINDIASTQLSNSSHQYEDADYTYRISIPSGVTISQINIRTKVSGVEVSQAANRLSGGTNSDGMGLITLSS